MTERLGFLESLRYRLNRRKRIRSKRRRMRKRYDAGHVIRGNVTVVVTDRATGRHLRTMETKNDITNIPLIIDLIHGTSADHVDINSNLVIKDSGGATVRTLSAMSSAPPAASGGQVALEWDDETVNTYNPDDIYLETTGSVEIAESLNVTWASKLATENWYFTWTLTIQSLLDTQFDTDGFDGMLDVITGRTIQHWDGTEGGNNMQMRVYDEVGSLEFTEIPVVASTQPTTTSIRWTFTKTAGVAYTWARVETWNAASGVRLYDDDIVNRAQGAADIFHYVITFSLSAA